MTVKGITIGDDTFALIMPDLLHFLKQKGFLPTTLTN